MVGFYALLPLIGSEEFALKSNTILLSQVVGFGVTKAVCNYYAGSLADRFGRRGLLVIGWLVALPIPVIVIFAPSWEYIVFSNILLGFNQGFAWSMTVIMKIDLVGPARRGLALGLNEFAGYFAISLTLLASGYLAATYSLRPEPFYLSVAFTVMGLALSSFTVRETRGHAALELRQMQSNSEAKPVQPENVFTYTTLKDRALSASCFAGLVNNLIFGMSWGLFPLYFASQGLGVDSINLIKAFYPGVWGVLQLATGPLSDKIGRKRLIITGQVIQALALWLTISVTGMSNWIFVSFLLGLGTALVYPTLLAAVSDVADPNWRGAALGTYRFWRDMGYAFGAIISGLLADLFDIPISIIIVGVLAFISAVVVAVRMYETLKPAGVERLSADGTFRSR